MTTELQKSNGDPSSPSPSSSQQPTIITAQTLTEIYHLLATHLLTTCSHFHTSHPNNRYIVSIAGIPGSGKSTLAAHVVALLNSKLAEPSHPREDSPPRAIHLGMDGFHIPLATLPPHHLPRRGAPHTYDPQGLITLLTQLKNHASEDIPAPTFSHALKDPLPSGLLIRPNDRIILVEGLYLHSTNPDWSPIWDLCDEHWFLDVEEEVARRRVVSRHVEAGLEETLQGAGERWSKNDGANAAFVGETRRRTGCEVEVVWRGDV
ncbi:P-loop containing nucleoside triphosphate hydrolase protein [Fimicolochytrium jonesii]|uniref:P-loop containing nucleoside triphosphate hydrolase protein n=1 Tax=Fimicolochytrium jonesii TaxID=1396493 RepID=UPI0022FDBC41|nr:P-loop containing nucleoside triphosphate hydrolase protein [Fimicolochytrium jonesii]KAI8816007.1 P-loop containing nucleoside triphosphate hydrolase protein [Fimicolochytrium jonesii]